MNRKSADEPAKNGEEFINQILNAAIAQRASDIHFEPRHDSYRVRFRVDGVLTDIFSHPREEYDTVLNTLKVLTDLDISNHHIPQDGHFEVYTAGAPTPAQTPTKNSTTENERNAKNFIDVRTSVFPTVNGEVVVLRLLNRSNALVTLNELGMDEQTLTKLRKILALTYGMILITGPTGSGKTTTLYSILSELKSEDKNIVTLEDPVEFHLDWMRQSEISEAHDFTFERAMSSILRQDPDVLMVGEIRDPHTAEYAVRSALVGRIVGSTIHANSTLGTIARLLELGIPRSLLAHALNGIIAQRLVRKICQNCKQPYQPNPLFLKDFGLDKPGTTFYHGAGCDQCKNTGFMGRIGIYAVLLFDDSLRNMIFEQKSLVDLEQYAITALGMRTLRMDAAAKILDGLTTVEEAAKVV